MSLLETWHRLSARHFGVRDQSEPGEPLGTHRFFHTIDSFAIYILLTVTAYWAMDGQALQLVTASLFALFLGHAIYSQKSQRFFVLLALLFAFVLASTVPLSIDDIGYELSARSVATQKENVAFLLRRVQSPGIFEFLAMPFLLFDWSKAIRLADPVFGLLIVAAPFGGKERKLSRAAILIIALAAIYAHMGEQNAAPFWTPVALLFALMSDPHRERLSLIVVLVSLLRPNLAPAAIALLAVRVVTEPKAWLAFVAPRRTLAASAILVNAALMNYSQTGHFWFPIDRGMFTSEFASHFFSQQAELQSTREILTTLGQTLSANGLIPIVALSLLFVLRRNWALQGPRALLLPLSIFAAVVCIALFTRAPQISRYWFPVLFALLLYAAQLLASVAASLSPNGFASRAYFGIFQIAMVSVMLFAIVRQYSVAQIEERIEVEFEMRSVSIDSRSNWDASVTVYVPGNAGAICVANIETTRNAVGEIQEVWSTGFRVRDISAKGRVDHAQAEWLGEGGILGIDQRICSSRLGPGVYEVAITLTPLLRYHGHNPPSAILTISADAPRMGNRSVELWPKPYTSREYPLVVTDPRYSNASADIHLSLGHNLADSIHPAVGNILIAADHAWWIVESVPALKAVAHRIYFSDVPFVVGSQSIAGWGEQFSNIVFATQLSLNFPFEFHEARAAEVPGQARIWSTWYVKARNELHYLESRCETNRYWAANAPRFVQLRCS